jgi:hypothetical protein
MSRSGPCRSLGRVSKTKTRPWWRRTEYETRHEELVAGIPVQLEYGHVGSGAQDEQDEKYGANWHVDGRFGQPAESPNRRWIWRAGRERYSLRGISNRLQVRSQHTAGGADILDDTVASIGVGWIL